MAVIQPQSPQEEQETNELPCVPDDFVPAELAKEYIIWEQQEEEAATGTDDKPFEPTAPYEEEEVGPVPVQPTTTTTTMDEEQGEYYATIPDENPHDSPVIIPPNKNKKKRWIVIAILSVAAVVAVAVTVAAAVVATTVDDNGGKESNGSRDEESDDRSSGGYVSGGGDRCSNVLAVSFATGEGTVVARGDTRNGGTTPTTTSCGISSSTNGLFYKYAVPLPEPGRVNITVCPLRYNDFAGGIRVAVMQGVCSEESGSFSVYSGGTATCTQSMVVYRPNFCIPGTSSLTFYNSGGKTFYVYVQPISSTDTGGPFELTFRRAWTQMGSDLYGVSSNGTFGQSTAVSGNGFLVVSGSTGAGTDKEVMAGPKSGEVRFFRQTGNGYVQDPGGPLKGPSGQLLFGHNLDVSDSGLTVAIASNTNINIYRITSSLTDLGKEIQLNQELNKYFGYAASNANETVGAVGSVAVSGDGNTVAVSLHTRYVYVYQRNLTGHWNQMGSPITGTFMEDKSNQHDKAVGISEDGRYLVVVTSFSTARTLKWTGSGWVTRAYVSGVTSVAHTDIGPGHCIAGGYGGSSSTKVSVWCHDDSDKLVQVGQTLNPSPTGNFGHSVAFSEGGSIMVVGSPWDGTTDDGMAWIYQWNGASRQWDLHGQIETGISYDLAGWSVAVSRNAMTVVVGVPWHSGNGIYRSDMVRVVRVFPWW